MARNSDPISDAVNDMTSGCFGAFLVFALTLSSVTTLVWAAWHAIQL